MPGALHCVLVRSPHAHARIVGIGADAALRRPGIVAVLTGAEMAKAQVGPMRPLWAIRSADGSPMAEPPRYALARDLVRHVGEPVAAVFADDSASPLWLMSARRSHRAQRGCTKRHPATFAFAGCAAMRRPLQPHSPVQRM